MFDFRSNENNERKRYRELILLSFFRLQLCFIDVQNNFYERIMQINRKNENYINYRQTLIESQIINENVFLQNCTNKNELLFKSDNL